MPTKPLSHAQRLRAANPSVHGRRVYDAAYQVQRLDVGSHPLEAEAESIRRSTRWRRLRTVVLHDEPLCRDCLVYDVLTPAIDVDHIVPLVELLARGERERAFDVENLQALCRSCHNRKTAAELRTTREVQRRASTGKDYEAIQSKRTSAP